MSRELWFTKVFHQLVSSTSVPKQRSTYFESNDESKEYLLVIISHKTGLLTNLYSL